MLKDFKIYQHEFFANLYLNPSTMDAYVEPPKGIHRVDFLFVKDEIKLGKIGPLGFEPVEVRYAILIEPDVETVVFREPYTAHIRQEDNLKRVTKREAADILIDPLVKLVGDNEKNKLEVNRFLDFLNKKFRFPKQ